jgi:methylmalonyl-CoA/ethylmalonyl-CoA epimerase
MHIDHIAIAVRSIDAAADELTKLLGYHRATEKVTNTRQRVNVVFLRKEASLDIKLIEPSDSDSPLWPSIRKGGGLHHICLRVPDTVKACADWAQAQVRVLDQPAPGEAFENHLIAFCYVGFGLNVELIDTDQRRGELTAPTA